MPVISRTISLPEAAAGGSDMEGWVFDYVIVGGGTAGCVLAASIMPLLIGGNAHASVVMIAEKASDLIKQARNPRARYLIAASATFKRERRGYASLRTPMNCTDEVALRQQEASVEPAP